MLLQRIQGNFFPKNYMITQRCGNSDDQGYVFELLSNSHSAKCPHCGKESIRAHSYQDRIVRDLPLFGESVTLLISQQRYFCDNEECEADIFTESSSFVGPYFHFTERCREYMLKVAALMNCESAAKILAYQGIRVSGDTLLNMLRAAGERYQSKVGRKIGVDDWAYRKGQKYGTLICDLETREIIDVLEGRDSETLEKWLQGHREIEVVSRDRASAYARAITEVLPEAVQIADRFHITKNLLEALNDTMKTFIPEVIEVPNAEIEKVSADPVSHTAKKTRKSLNVRLHRYNGAKKSKKSMC